MDARGNRRDVVNKFAFLAKKHRKKQKTDAQQEADRRERKAQEAKAAEERAERKIQGALAAKERYDFLRTPRVIQRKYDDAHEEWMDALQWNSNEKEVEEIKDRMDGYKDEIADKEATLETLLEETAHTVESMQKQVETLKAMRSWYEIPSQNNNAKKERIDTKVNELSRRLRFLVEAAEKERKERERKEKNRAEKERRKNAIDNNDPERYLLPSELEEPDGWWYTDGMRRAQKKIDRDTKEAALFLANEEAEPVLHVPQKVDLPPRASSRSQWETALNALLAKFGWLAVKEGNEERARVEQLVATYKASQGH